MIDDIRVSRDKLESEEDRRLGCGDAGRMGGE